MNKNEPGVSSVAPRGAAGTQPLRVSSRELLAGARELVIVHADQEYRLRLTSQGKLILTK